MSTKLNDYEPGQWWLQELEAMSVTSPAGVKPDMVRAAKVACDFAKLVFANRATSTEERTRPVVPVPEHADPAARLVVAVSTIEPGATVIVSLVQPGRMTMLYSESHPAGKDSLGNVPLPAGLFAAPADVDAAQDELEPRVGKREALYPGYLVPTRDHAFAQAATIARDYARGMATAGKASDLIRGRWEGENAASVGIARRIEERMSTDGRREFARQYGEPVQGTVFDVHGMPLLTDRQVLEARSGICPRCFNHSLIDQRRGEGLRYMGCLACHAVAILASRPDDRPLVALPGRRHGRVYLAQQVSLAMRMYEERGGDAAGYCIEGEKNCVCGGDTPGVRACCDNWRKA